MIMDFVVDNRISVFFATETWLTDLKNHTTATIKQYGYKIHHCFRDNMRGGGVAIIFKPSFNVVKLTVSRHNTFESISVKLKLLDNTWMVCSCIYRPEGSISTFLDEFDFFLEEIFLVTSKIILCGDINIHLDICSPDTKNLINLIESYGLSQLVNEPTHKSGHTLDVVIASHKVVKDNSLKVLAANSQQFPTCDHFSILFSLSCNYQSVYDSKTICFRNNKKIDLDIFKLELASRLNTDHTETANFEKVSEKFNTVCTSILDGHAPLLRKIIREVYTAKWLDSEYKAARVRRRSAEKKWKKSGLESDYWMFCELRQFCNDLADRKKNSFYRSKFSIHNNSQKGLYEFVNTFLDQCPEAALPPSETIQNVVNDFNNFFTDKIDKIHEAFPKENSTATFTKTNDQCPKLTSFEPTTVGEIKDILKENKIKTSSNDPLPAFLLQDNIDELLPFICDLVNISLSSGSIDGEKLAHITPLIKSQSLDSSCLKNYRPISNLSFIAKLIERVVLRRLNKHMSDNNLNIPHQSAYKKFHSCETVLIRIVNDVLIASDENKATVLMLLDLSAAFDTVYHPKLFSILKNEIGIDGIALSWFKSFLSGRCQKVKINSYESEEIIIKFGVPQGSVLGPVLFNIYIRSIYKTVLDCNFLVQGFADDHQIYRSFNHQEEFQILVRDLPACFLQIEKWMASHYLQLNSGKTEIIVFAKNNVLSKIDIHGTFIKPSTCIRFVSTAKNLGFKLDSQLAFTTQINHLKRKTFNMLRKIAKMKKFLSAKQCETLVHALVLSSLDYCNSLYMGASSRNMKQLQSIQNRACKTIIGLKKQSSVTEHLQKLHWLKVQERVEFKIILLTFKCLNGLAPSYLSDLLHYNHLSGSHTPSLQQPIVKTIIGLRASSSSDPKLWNNLPLDLKQCDDINIFKSKLKTFCLKNSTT